MRRPLACLAITLLATAGTAVLPTAAHADGIRDSQWHLESLGVDTAHRYAQGDGVTIGLLDTGVDATHPDLEGNIKPGKAFGDATDDGTTDTDGHGTGVASLLNGQGDNDGILGIAPQADIVSVAAHCQEPRCEGDQPAQWLKDGIDWLAEQDVDIIVATTTADGTASDVDAATAAGIPVIASAGNSGPDPAGHLGSQDDNATAWPARIPEVIPVTGTTKDNKKWSNSQDLKDDEGPDRGMAAPAVDLPAATPGGHYATQSDTALATALVAGTLALIKSAHRGLDDDQAVERLTRTADDLGESGYDEKFGWGGVNPTQALMAEVEHANGTTSTKSDMLRLERQATSQSGDESSAAAAGDSVAAAQNSAASSSPWALVLVTVGTVIFAAAITLTLITLRRKRHAQVAAERETGEESNPQ